MQSPLSLRNWIVFILVTVFVAALTAFIVVRVLTQAASQPDMAVVNAPAIPTVAPALPAQAAPADATAAAPDANATPQSVLVPAATDANAAVAEATVDPNAAPVATPADNTAASTPIAATEATTATGESVAPAKVRISTVVFPGQRSREAVVIVNEGDQADLTGWTLSNPRGQVYTFGNVLLLKENFINLHTTSGVDIPTDLFWNQEEAIWQAGDLATLKRGEEVMATFEVK
jgi:hypothetical protein